MLRPCMLSMTIPRSPAFAVIRIKNIHNHPLTGIPCSIGVGIKKTEPFSVSLVSGLYQYSIRVLREENRLHLVPRIRLDLPQ